MRTILKSATLALAATAVLAIGNPVDASTARSAQPAVTETTALAGARVHPCWELNGQWWCHNRVPAPIIVNGNVVDNLRHSPTVIDCQAELDRHGIGPHPRRWVHARGDDHNATGWIKDSDIISETSTLPVC